MKMMLNAIATRYTAKAKARVSGEILAAGLVLAVVVAALIVGLTLAPDSGLPLGMGPCILFPGYNGTR